MNGTEASNGRNIAVCTNCNSVWKSGLYLDPDQTLVSGFIITAGVEAADMKI